jgi:hypothetical protein
MGSYKYIEVAYISILVILTIIVGILYWKKNQVEGFQENGSVYIFYHIYCNEKTTTLVKDQVSKIIFSPLYTKIKTVYCFLTGEPNEITNIKTLLSKYGNKFQVSAEGPGDTTYERFTLLKIKNYIKPEDKLLYLHTKGISIKMDEDAIYWWRNYMEYFLIANGLECIKLLDKYDIAGVAYSTHNIGPHYSGNFWWSTGKYYLSLSSVIGSSYNDPEKYIFSGDPKYMILDKDRFNNIEKGGDLNLYGNSIYPKEYLY